MHSRAARVTACMNWWKHTVVINKDMTGDLLCVSLQLAYSRQFVVSVAGSTQQLFLTAQGQGEDLKLEFCPSELELGPCPPCSTKVEAEVTVKNPCSFPIEFYSLEFDEQYLEEEKVHPFFSKINN